MRPAPDRSAPQLLAARDQQPDWTIPPQAGSVGFVRAKCTMLDGTAFNAGTILIPFGQTTPVHSNTCEHIIFQLEGEVEFEIEGGRHALAPRDMLFIPAEAPYAYTNTGRSTASFISIIAKLESWPHEATYFYDEPPNSRRRNPMSATDRPWILKSRDQQPEWTLPKADTVGFIRGRCNSMEGTSFSAGLVLMPFGQTTPLHSSSAEHIIFQLDGEVEFTIEGERYPLLPRDMLFIPADVKYVYTNVGRTTATFISVLSKVDSWPHKGTYYD